MKREDRYGYGHSAVDWVTGTWGERHSIELLSGAVDALVVCVDPRTVHFYRLSVIVLRHTQKAQA